MGSLLTDFRWKFEDGAIFFLRTRRYRYRLRGKSLKKVLSMLLTILLTDKGRWVLLKEQWPHDLLPTNWGTFPTRNRAPIRYWNKHRKYPKYMPIVKAYECKQVQMYSHQIRDPEIFCRAQTLSDMEEWSAWTITRKTNGKFLYLQWLSKVSLAAPLTNTQRILNTAKNHLHYHRCY